MFFVLGEEGRRTGGEGADVVEVEFERVEGFVGGAAGGGGIGEGQAVAFELGREGHDGLWFLEFVRWLVLSVSWR